MFERNNLFCEINHFLPWENILKYTFRKCPVRAKFGDLTRQTNLKKLDNWLNDKDRIKKN